MKKILVVPHTFNVHRCNTKCTVGIGEAGSVDIIDRDVEYTTLLAVQVDLPDFTSSRQWLLCELRGTLCAVGGVIG